MWEISFFISDMGVKILGKVFPGIPMYIIKENFSLLGDFAYIDMPMVYPAIPMVFGNIVIILLLLAFLITGKRKGKALPIYFMLSSLIHLIGCIFFLFAANHFPYTIKDYSNLYMEQQMGIWISFILLISIATGIEGSRGYIYKILTVVACTAYSLIFGAVRYIVFLFILQQFSVLYMPLMFFVFGPMFDFVYLVFIYSFFINKTIELYDSGEGKGDWQWA